MCSHFSAFWHQTELTRKEQENNHGSISGHSKGLSVIGSPGPKFVRLERYWKREPKDAGPCPHCGEPDRWKCWSKTRRLELFGMGRR